MTLEERKNIRDIYDKLMPALLRGYPRISPYFYDWKFTPIEDSIWYDIRVLGLPFYPQFPIGPYFVDFADPVKMIAIEVDGREWHQDVEKDEKRQRFIEGLGWTVYRITGSQAYRKIYENHEKDYNRDTESFKVIFEISREYKNQPILCLRP